MKSAGRSHENTRPLRGEPEGVRLWGEQPMGLGEESIGEKPRNTLT